MKSYRFSHLTDHALGKFLADALRHERGDSAVTLSALAEFDLRRLYLPAGYPSMFRYCIGELHMSEDSALKRIRAARVAREFPAIYPALADGRLNLSAVLTLRRCLTTENVEQLLAAAAHKTRVELELLLADCFPQADVPTQVSEVAPGPVAALDLKPVGATMTVQLAPGPVESTNSRARIAPLSPGRFALQVTLDAETHEQLHYAQSLLGHAVRSGDIAAVLKRALDALVRELEKQKFGSRVRTRPRRSSANSRYVPADVRRTVWQRDGGQCTFASQSGKRCGERADLEFDHVEPLARGGRTTASNLRLRCRGHNQYEAERAFGTGFMRGKRDQARRRVEANAKARAEAAAEKARTEAAARAAAETATARTAAAVADVIPVLRHLGFKAEEARQGASRAAHLAGAPLEQRLRVALQSLAPPCHREPAPASATP